MSQYILKLARQRKPLVFLSQAKKKELLENSTPRLSDIVVRCSILLRHNDSVCKPGNVLSSFRQLIILKQRGVIFYALFPIRQTSIVLPQYKITSASNIKVMGITEMIVN